MSEQTNMNIVTLDAKQLALELNAFCEQLFGFTPNADLLERYQQANAVIFSKIPKTDYCRQNRRLTRAITKKRDLEALEYAWRFTNRTNILTRKLHAFMFLIETEPQYYIRFVNHQKKRVTAYFVLGLLGMRSAWKLFKGMVGLLTMKEGRA